MKRLIAILTLCATVLAQAPQPVTTPQLIVPVTTVQPSPALGASLSIVGNPGHSTYYYWIVDNYQVGNAVAAGPFMIQQAPDVLSVSNYVAVYPSLPGDQSTFDVLRTSSPIAPSGSCNCAVATAQTSGPVNDQSNSLSSYTVSIANLQVLSLTLTNEVQGAGSSDLILRQAGIFVADLSAALSGAYLPLQPSTTIIIQGTSPTVNVGFACGVGAANNQNCFQVLNSSLTNLLSLTNGGQLTLGTGSGGSFTTGTINANQIVIPEMAAPSNPSFGNELLYADLTAHTLKCLTSSGGSCLPTGSVSSITLTAPLAGGPITTTGTISITGLAGGVLAGSGPAFTATPVLGVAGTTVGSLGLQNATSGTVTLQPVAGALGTVTINIPAAAGTLAVSATAPITESATGAIACATCATTTNGGALSATAPIAISAAGVISITSPLPVANGGTALASGTSGGVLAFTASGTIASSGALGSNNLVLGGGAGSAPSTSAGLSSNGNAQLILGVSGVSNGGINFNNTTSGGILLATVTGALGSNTISLPAATGTVAVSATAPITESVTGAIACATCATTTNGGALSATAPVAISVAGVISLSGTVGQIPNGATGAFTATPTLGAVGTAGTLTLSGVTSGTGTIGVDATAANYTLNGFTVTNGAGAITLATTGTNANLLLSPNGTGLVQLPTGSATQIAAKFGSTATVGFAQGSTAAQISMTDGTLSRLLYTVSSTPVIRMASGATLAWSGTAGDASQALTAGISQSPNGVIDFGLGTQGATTALLASGMTVATASNFTTANNTSLQTITGLSFSLPSAAIGWSLDCAGAYSQATGAAAVAFGIQSATTAPTNIFATGYMQNSTTTPFWAQPGILATLTTTTATNIVSATPGATGTNYVFELHARIVAAGGGASTINIMVSTATGADAVTVLSGATCSLHP